MPVAYLLLAVWLTILLISTTCSARSPIQRGASDHCAALARQPVGELAQPFDMALPSLMKHIRVLETGGLVESEKHGRVRTCRLMPGAMKGAENWLAEQRAIWEARLDRLKSYVATLEKKPPRRRRD